jgi:hypothetical protein
MAKRAPQAADALVAMVVLFAGSTAAAQPPEQPVAGR